MLNTHTPSYTPPHPKRRRRPGEGGAVPRGPVCFPARGTGGGTLMRCSGHREMRHNLPARGLHVHTGQRCYRGYRRLQERRRDINKDKMRCPRSTALLTVPLPSLQTDRGRLK
ncbi:hypothetical protein DPEC_G00311490 [Dallia pectoralis]|uniref:Uncharacterized protein n=1 Tax=Dallia pectoralis TaxID=75939 RepID=A0ACC2FBA5_DALPE|nr:hypothetical protein DPEC_G00311490 [Dallia pectoralis]